MGGGPFELKAGQITDDTQMAICLARSLVANVGNQTASALGAIEGGANVGTAGREVWHRSGRRAAGNGSLMRTRHLITLAETAAILHEAGGSASR